MIAVQLITDFVKNQPTIYTQKCELGLYESYDLNALSLKYVLMS